MLEWRGTPANGRHPTMKTLTVLGSTGSIGTSTLDVIRNNRHLYEVYALVAGTNVEVLAFQIVEFRPSVVAVATADGLERLKDRLVQLGLPKSGWPELLWGDAARVQVATASPVDTVVSAIVGIAGLEATFA